MTDSRNVSLEDFNRITQELERAQELREADTSKMTLAQKIEHQRAIKAAMKRARANPPAR